MIAAWLAKPINHYVGGGPVVGALIAVALITAVRGLPDQEEQEAAQGGAPGSACPGIGD